MSNLQPGPEKTVIVVGGGVAGMSAACALAEAGLRVTLVERRGYLGGRATSYRHPGVDEVIDNCQHVLFGCCTGRAVVVTGAVEFRPIRVARAFARAAATDDGQGVHARR